MLRRLGFALRAIGDARAVPALIRALPATLLAPSSDYGLLVGDQSLLEFMQAHDLSPEKGGAYFDLGRAVREIVGALHALTGKNFDDGELFSISLSEDPRREALQRRIFVKQAQRWKEWWEANARDFTDDPAYQKCALVVGEDRIPPVTPIAGRPARLTDGMSHAVLSPATEEGWQAVDLDTGYSPRWPARIPRDEAARDAKQLAEWAAESGVDLICVTRRLPDGTETYVLQGLGMTVREINARDLRNLERLLADGKVPEGRPVVDLLMPYDADSRKLVPDANGAFLFITREGNLGIIETTDRVTRTGNVRGQAAPPAGAGFHKGVRFNVRAIVPN
jgi:hypothetical protein